jgi:hypothetical protein
MHTLEAHLIESFILFNRFLQKNDIRYCLIGGLAAGYWGEPRFTRDMDFTVHTHTGKLAPFIDLLKKGGFVITEKGEGQVQVLAKGPLTFQADIILAETEYQDWVVQRAVTHPMFSVQVPICSAEDLVILKLIANRRQDLLDIESVMSHQKKILDIDYLKKWISFWDLEKRYQKEFGKTLPLQ